MSMSMDVTYLGLRASDFFTAPAPSGERLDVFELYSDVASIRKAAVQAGKTSATFDNEGDKRQDVLTKEGFQMALHSVLRIVRGGLLTCAPKCGSFVAACQANHNRCAANNFTGWHKFLATMLPSMGDMPWATKLAVLSEEWKMMKGRGNIASGGE